MLSINNLSAQNQVKISGVVVEDSTLLAVPFATVAAKEIATLTDINGAFSLTIGSAISSDSIIFSCIGYESKIISEKYFLKGEQTVTLVKKVYELNGPEIHGLSSGEIVKKAIGKIPEIFGTDTFYQAAFYRQYHEENNTYVRLIEASVTIENCVEKNSALKSKERVSINQLRRSDNNEKNNEEHGDHLMDLLEENPVYHSIGTVLNLKAINLYRFYLDTTRTYPDSVYHIYYYSTDRSGERFDRGEIFINAADFAITKITKEEFKNVHAVRKALRSSSAPYIGSFYLQILLLNTRCKKEKCIQRY